MDQGPDMSPTFALARLFRGHLLHALIASGALAAATLAGCGGGAIHQAPANPTAEGGENQVELSWTAVPGAKKYTIRWEDTTAGETGFPNEIKDLTDTDYVHTGLTNFHSYRYQLYASGSGGDGPGSVIVSAEPGPIPATVEWATVVTEGTTQKIYFDEAADADEYRVYLSTQATALTGRRPVAGFLIATSSPYVLENLAANAANYYRVIGYAGTRLGFDGPVAISSTFAAGTYDLPAAAPALADTDADDCLDLVVATGDCLGVLEARDLAAAGLDGLFAAGRINGDSRFLDVNADGQPDIYSDVRSAATATASRAILHLNQGNGTFLADPGVAALSIGGQGGTVLAADFDNDGDIDIFAPHDWTGTDGGRNWLLVNDGGGAFTDAAAAAGVQTGPAGAAYVPGGGQAVDFNEDGRVDILFGSRLLINNGDGSFSDGSAAAGLTAEADQGMNLFDVDLDGDLDLVRFDGTYTRLYLNNGGVFGAGTVVNGDPASRGAGLAVCDVNSDGFQDVVMASNAVASGKGAPQLLVNVNGQLLRSDLPQETVAGSADLIAANDLLSCADLDGSGVADIVARWGGLRLLLSVLPLQSVLRIRVLGAGGERNQQGHVVKIVPGGVPGRTMTRVVESGSGLRSQGDYDLLVGAPWAGDYEVSVRFKDGWVTTTAQPGDKLTIYADGRVADGLQ
jgi:hypothetical protein